MINAGFHVLAWGLVAALVWASWFQAPAPAEPPFRALAALDDGFYLVGAQADAGPRFGLLKHDAGGLGFRGLVLEDWDGVMQGELQALCAVPDYPGEVIALVAGARAQTLVHLQIRRWGGSPKSAILSHGQLPEAGKWQTLACGKADAASMPVTLSGVAETGNTVTLRGRLNFEPLNLADTVLGEGPSELPAAHYLAADGHWRAYTNATGSQVTFEGADSEERLVYRIDGFTLVALAAGPGLYPLSFVASDPDLGNVWRPLSAQ